MGFSANLLPPTGNPPGYLFGYGFFTTEGTQGPAPSITMGGQTIKNPSAIPGYGLGTLEVEGFYVPSGTAGDSVSIQVSSSLGSGKLTSVATYYPSPTFVPASGLLQIIYDSHRDLIYALKATEVDVLNLTTLQWQSPMVFPTGATGPYTAMALSPDGSKLVVAGIVPNTTNGTYPQLIVFNPGSSSPGSLFTYIGNATVGASITITNSNTVVMVGGQGLVFDLSSLAFTQPPNLFALAGFIRSSADGSHLYAAALDSSNGEVYSIDPSTYAVQSAGYGYLFWSDLAVSPDGAHFAAVDAPPYATGSAVGFFDSGLHYLNTNVYPDFSPPDDIGVIGAAFSPAGKVLVVPLGDSLEIWDTATGGLRARLMTPEELHVISYPQIGAAPMMAMDPTGQTIFAVSASGLTVLKLPEPLDQLPAAQWQAFVPRGDHKNPVYGSITARMKAMRRKLRK